MKLHIYLENILQLLLFLVSAKLAQSAYNYTTYSVGDFYYSTHVFHNRTAIILTGQMRSGNLSWFSGYLRANTWKDMFGADDPLTSIETQLEFLIKQVALNGGVDVFMYQVAHPEDNNDNWDGNPANYKAVSGDNRICHPYSKSQFFQPGSGNNFFCLVEDEVEIMDQFTAQSPLWKYYTYGWNMHLREQAIQQYYQMYRANLAAKQFALANNFSYTYKVRLRPDTAAVFNFPPLSSIQYRKGEQHLIKVANKMIYKNGYQDSFNLGLSEDMDCLLDRLIDFTEKKFHIYFPLKTHWDLENHLEDLMRTHNMALSEEGNIWMKVIRLEHWGLNGWFPQPRKNVWQQIF